MAGPRLVLTLAGLGDPAWTRLAQTGAGGSDELPLVLDCPGFALSWLGPAPAGPWLWMTWRDYRLFWLGPGRY